jgi:nicotinate-nucleotide adenylyltransferase
VSVEALRRLALDEVWWLVSPQNPLKPIHGMAPLAVRVRQAKRVARHPRIRVTDVEVRLGTTVTADTIAGLRRLYPQLRFIWLMGADNLAQLHRWHRWRELARMVPIAVFARPHYVGGGYIAPAMGWLRRRRRRASAARHWADWEPPAIVILHIRLDPTSATSIRERSPGWAAEPGERA